MLPHHPVSFQQKGLPYISSFKAKGKLLSVIFFFFASDQPCFTSATCPHYPGQPNNLSMLHIVNRIFHPRPQAYLGKTRGSSKHRRREREPFIAQSNTLKLHEIVTSDLKTIFSYGAKSFSFFYQQHLLEMGKSSVSPVLRDPSSTNLQEHAQKSQWDRQAPTSAAWQLQEFVFLFINKKWGFFFIFFFYNSRLLKKHASTSLTPMVWYFWLVALLSMC